MLGVKFIDANDNDKTVYIEIEPIFNETPNTDYNYDREEKLDNLFKKEHRVVFCIERLDNDGIIGRILIRSYKLSNSQKVIVKTSNALVKEVIMILMEEKVIFIDE